ILQAISECAVGGTRALAAWVTLDNEDDVAAWVGAAGVPGGFRELLRPAVAAAITQSAFSQALAGHGFLIHADARRLSERTLWMAAVVEALKSLPWQPAATAALLHRGTVVGHLTAIYREGEVPSLAESTFLRVLAAHAATAAVNARLLAAAREKVKLEERLRLARELHDSVSQ